MKSNKSFNERMRVTKNGKIMTRAKGQCHYNAKESGEKGLAKRKMKPAAFLTSKIKQRFLPGQFN